MFDHSAKTLANMSRYPAILYGTNINKLISSFYATRIGGIRNMCLTVSMPTNELWNLQCTCILTEQDLARVHICYEEPYKTSAVQANEDMDSDCQRSARQIPEVG